MGGYLPFGKDRFDRFPNAWVQAGRFGGKDRARLVDSTEICGHPPQAAEDAIGFVQRHMSPEAVIGTVHRADRWTVPLVALREAIVIAIVHADYAERGSPIRVALSDAATVKKHGAAAHRAAFADRIRGGRGQANMAEEEGADEVYEIA